MRRAAAIVVASALLSAMVSYGMRSDESRAPTVPAAPRAVPAAATVDAQRDDGRMAELQQRIVRLELEARARATPEAATNVDEEVVEEAQAAPEQRAERRAERQSHLDETLAFEPRDDSWAHEVEFQAAETVRRIAPDAVAELTDIRCASTFCRAELRYASAEKGAAIVAKLTLEPPFATRGTVFSPSPEVTYLYFTRDGAPLPN